MWTAIVGKLLGGFAPQLAEIYIEKKRLKQEVVLEQMRGKVAYEKAKTIRAENSEGRDHEWELLSIKNSGWKDEWVLIIMSIPMVFVFIPFTQDTIMKGFVALGETPLWYRTTVMTIYLATFGIRLWRRDMNKSGAPSILS